MHMYRRRMAVLYSVLNIILKCIHHQIYMIAPWQQSNVYSAFIYIYIQMYVYIYKCIRCANRAVMRERYTISTVDDILYDLKGSEFSGKRDPWWDFHQIEVDEQSR